MDNTRTNREMRPGSATTERFDSAPQPCRNLRLGQGQERQGLPGTQIRRLRYQHCLHQRVGEPVPGVDETQPAQYARQFRREVRAGHQEVYPLLIEPVFPRVAVAVVEEHQTPTCLANLTQYRGGLGLSGIGRIMHHLRAFQLTHGHPGTQGGKPGGEFRLGHETVESP